jgi:TldD protein
MADMAALYAATARTRLACAARVLELLADLMDSAAGHADYADARHVRTRAERVTTRNGGLDDLDRSDSAGFGVRVRVGGAWGFAAVRGEERSAAEEALAHALDVARAQPAAPGGELAPEAARQGSYASPLERDPFDTPLEQKLELLLAADEAVRAQPRVATARARFDAFRHEKSFASTEGSACQQVLTECGAGIFATAIDGDQTQTRSYPASHDGNVAQAGFEHVEGLRLTEAAPRVAEEAVALLSAPACLSGTTTLILAGEQLETQLHESVGHALELDRVLGREASYAGTSFVAPSDPGALRFGSELMNVTADATIAGGLGSFRWDDEGVEAQSVPLVRDGVLRGFLSSRETAAELGLPRSGGCMRADGFGRQPLVRMTNVNLEPGDAGTLDDLIADTDRGILIETNRSWSIDSRRLQFQFEGEAAWEIVGGRRGRLLRNPSYAGVTPSFWAGLDAVCSQSEWRLGSFVNCGKGEPGQFAHVSHGCAPARFREVEVGVA